MATQTLDWQIRTAGLNRSCLRVGAIMNDLVVPEWIHQALRAAESSPFATFVLLATVLDGNALDSSRPAGAEQSMPLLLRLWYRWDQAVFARRSANPHALHSAHFTPAAGTRLLNCPLLSSECGSFISDADRKEILNAELDVLLNFTSTVPDGQLVGLASCGVWSFAPPRELLRSVFWTVYQNEPVMENGVEVLAPQTGEGSRAYAYTASDRFSLFRNYTNSCWHRSAGLQLQLAVTYRDRHQGVHPQTTTPMPKHSFPRNGQVLRLIPRTLKRALSQQINKRFMRERWFLAFRPLAVGAEDAKRPFTLIWPPQDHFYADPFVMDKDKTTYVFFEDYSYARGKGVISYIELNENGQCSEPRLALEENYHLAYPCIFQHGGEIFCLPETKNNRTVQLYRAVKFPNVWKLSHVLLSDISGADSTLVFHHGKFWLFTSGLGTRDPWFDADNELSLFFANSLSGPWTEHPQNPIVADVRNARSAGQFLLYADQLIRPAQDCSRVYGYAVSLNRVELLSEREYRETRIGMIAPDWMHHNRGTHTFNRSGKYEVIDGRTMVSRFHQSEHKPTFEMVTPTKPLINFLSR